MMAVSESALDLDVLADPERRLELHRGRLREKPIMSIRHNFVAAYLGAQLIHQLDERAFQVRINAGHVRRGEETSYIPDVFVIPAALIEPDRNRWDARDIYDAPLPLVVEIWSPSTGSYDVDEKIPEYHLRGDLEIWRIHPFKRTLTAWRRQSDGSYVEAVCQSGTIQPVALPGVTVDLDALFE